jgi:predicted Co/Zn/Cd cation transporter (cation efflux family)
MSVSCLSLSIFQALGIASFLFLRTLGNDSYSLDFYTICSLLSSVMTQDSKALPKYKIQNNVMGDEHVKPTTLAMTVEMACHQCM